MNYCSVVWADDDEDDLRMFNEAADQIDQNLVIISVHNGRELLDYLRQAARGNELPSMIVMDMNMPLVSGHEALVQIKNDEQLRDIPVAVLTTSNSPKDLTYCSKFAVRMFTKPWLFSGIRDVVRNILELREHV